MKSITVIIPTYNERENIQRLVDEILTLSLDIKVLVVDDDSPDRTWQVAEDMAREDNRVRVMRRIGRKGLTSAIAEGVAAIETEAVVWLDADCSHPPAVIRTMVRELTDYDIVVASRYVNGGSDKRDSRLRVLASRWLNRFARFVLRTKVMDLTSGFVAVRKEVFTRVRISGDYGEYCIRFIYDAERRGYKIMEVPYSNIPRFRGVTKTDASLLKFFQYGIQYLITIFSLRLRLFPLKGIFRLIINLPTSRGRKIVYSMLRKRYLWYFRGRYVLQQLETRKGSCQGCAGKCCKLTLPWHCPYLAASGLCAVYEDSGQREKIPLFCRIYPIDEKDIELTGMKGICRYYW